MEEVIKFFETNLESVMGTRLTHVQLSQIVEQAKMLFIKAPSAPKEEA